MADRDFNIIIRTIADATGINQVESGLEGLQSKFAGGIGGGLAATAGVGVLAAAAFGAKKLVDAVIEANQQQIALNDELEKESEKLDKNAEKWLEAARAADSEAEVLAIINRALPQIEAGQEKVTQLQRQGLTATQAGVAEVAKLLNLMAQLKGLPPILDPDTYKKTQDQINKGFEAAQSRAVEAAQDVITLGKEQQEFFDANKMRPTAEVIAEINRQMDGTRDLQKDIDTGTAEGIKLWKQYGDQIDNDTKLLKKFQALQSERDEIDRAADAFGKQQNADNERRLKQQEQLSKQAERDLGAASPQAKAILENEQAARKAAAEGRERDAEQFQTSADQFRKSALPQQQAEASRIDAEMRAAKANDPQAFAKAVGDAVERVMATFWR